MCLSAATVESMLLTLLLESRPRDNEPDQSKYQHTDDGEPTPCTGST